MADAGDDYARVPVILMAICRDSIRVRRGAVATWIPRSLIHGGDDNLLRAMRVGEEMTIRIFRWKALQAGLLFREATQRNLFG